MVGACSVGTRRPCWCFGLCCVIGLTRGRCTGSIVAEAGVTLGGVSRAILYLFIFLMMLVLREAGLRREEGRPGGETHRKDVSVEGHQTRT